MASSLGFNHSVNFLDGLQADFVNRRGNDLILETAVSCVCRVEDTYSGMRNDGKDNRREPFCKRCGGDGWIFRNPRKARGLVTSIRQQKNILDAGIAQPGDMLFSPLPGAQGQNCDSNGESVIGLNDKLTATWSQPLDDGQVLRRGAGTLGENAALITHLNPDQDRIWYEPDNSVWCEDEDGIVYHQGGDFLLGPGKVITWVGKKPYVNKRYTLKYQAFFEWLVFLPPMERYDNDQNIGQLVFLRKRHIALVNDNPVVTDSDKISLKSKISC
jgi:hypothetical protein